jgi:hypothetical protein
MIPTPCKQMIVIKTDNITILFVISLPKGRFISCAFRQVLVESYPISNQIIFWRSSCPEIQVAENLIHAQSFERQLRQLDCEDLARLSGFQKRTPRKIVVRDFIKALCAAGALSKLSFNLLAMLLGLVGGGLVSKQGLAKRVNERCVAFLQDLLGPAISLRSGSRQAQQQGLFASFVRVLIQDSTYIPLPDHLAQTFPSGRNHLDLKKATLKIQALYELISDRMLHFGFSAFHRNDQAASPDILDVARPGDLVLRDLGYFVLPVFNQLNQRGIFFLSRLRSQVKVFDPQTGRPLHLLSLVRKHPTLDQDILLGQKEKVPVRLVALPVPEAVANERRRKAKENRDRRCRPSKETLELLGWQFFILNVPPTVWDTPTVAKVYALRWRIEIIFKAWKSHFNLTEIPQGGSESLILSCLFAKLLYITFFHAFFDQVHRQLMGWDNPRISLLKLAVLSAIMASLLMPVQALPTDGALIPEIIQRLCAYEKRHDRQNFFEKLSALG